MYDSVKNTKLRISLLKLLGELFQYLCGGFACFRAYGGIVHISNLKNDLVEVTFLSAVADMVIVVLDNTVFAFLPPVVFGQSLIKKFVINVLDIFFDDNDIVFYSVAVNVIGNEITVIVG